MIDELLERVSKLTIPGFFITAETSHEGKKMPDGIENFIHEKLTLIHKGSNIRKFVFQEEEWRIVFTFFPTDRRVDEKYALKNKVLFKKPSIQNKAKEE